MTPYPRGVKGGDKKTRALPGEFWLEEMLAAGIMRVMKTLVETNIFLRSPRQRRRMLAHNALESSVFEGARRLRAATGEGAKGQVVRPRSRRPLSKAAANNAVNGS
jgi:hypothetical protein